MELSYAKQKKEEGIKFLFCGKDFQIMLEFSGNYG